MSICNNPNGILRQDSCQPMYFEANLIYETWYYSPNNFYLYPDTMGSGNIVKHYFSLNQMRQICKLLEENNLNEAFSIIFLWWRINVRPNICHWTPRWPQKIAASEPNEKYFPFMSNLRMSLKLIFMIIQDDLGGHYGKRFDVGEHQNSWTRQYNDYKNVG